MEFNKIVSLALGVIVVILILVWIGNRLRAISGRALFTTVQITPSPAQKTTIISPTPNSGWSFFSWLQSKPSPIPTTKVVQGDSTIISPTYTPPTIRVTETYNNDYRRYSTDGTPLKEIPSTGASTFLIPLAAATLFGGIFIKRKK